MDTLHLEVVLLHSIKKNFPSAKEFKIALPRILEMFRELEVHGVRVNSYLLDIKSKQELEKCLRTHLQDLMLMLQATPIIILRHDDTIALWKLRLQTALENPHYAGYWDLLTLQWS
jgi:hypothetical protein